MLLRKFILIIMDIIFFIFSGFAFAYLEGFVNIDMGAATMNMCILAFVAVAVRTIIGGYKNLLRYASTIDYLRFVVADSFTLVSAYVANRLFKCSITSINSIIFIMLFSLVLSLTARFVYKVSRYTILKSLIKRYRGDNEQGRKKRKNVVIVGAGYFGSMLAKELVDHRNGEYNICYFVDRDRVKTGSYVHGIKVCAENGATVEMLKKRKIDEIIIALPDIDTDKLNELYTMYREVCSKVLVYESPLNDVSAKQESDGKLHLRDINIEDLLFRSQKTLNREVMAKLYSEKTILITGGGGSIGSEICRQLAKMNPKKLVVLDIYENNAYDVRQELLNSFGAKLDVEIEIVSITDRASLETVFKRHKPDVVFHAAAHKHVPLMEHNPREAVLNNIFGTYNVCDMAEKYKVKKFIMISTDKAVNPTNIMGATKRMCEMVVLSRADSETEFAAVRFGNVLGSNGSVIPLFKRQIESGGPVTITDKRIIRYFMTIPEASQLVMYAGAIAKRSELFVLDMGKPVKIVDLAENLIRLSGYIPYKDIDIKEIGLRPGEKLYEELLMNSDNLKKTDNEQIFIEKEIQPSRLEVNEKMEKLRTAVDETAGMTEEAEIIKAVMKDVVPTYKEPEFVNMTAEKVIAKDLQ